MTQRHVNIVIGCCVCVAWGGLIFPFTSVAAGYGQKYACNEPVDCSSSCSCTNAQIDPEGPGVACVHVCAEQIQNYNLHRCKFTGNNNDNCPNETSKLCGTGRVNTEQTIVVGRNCEDNDYPTFNDCNGGDTYDVYVLACD